MSEFFSNLFNIVLWVAIGIVAGLLISWLIGLICKKRLSKIASIAICVISIACSLGIGTFFKKDGGDETNKPYDDKIVYDNLVVDVGRNWGNTNGGFTFEQIVDSQDDNECPVLDDAVIEMRVQDYGDYVCFSRTTGNFIIDNAVFLKTENGLIYDGVLGITADIECWFKFWTLGIRAEWDLATFTMSQQHIVPSYYIDEDVALQLCHEYNNLASLSANNFSFVKRDLKHWRIDNPDDACNFIYDKVFRNIVPNNITDHFIKFSDFITYDYNQFENVELIGTSENAYTTINSFYNHLYEQLKSSSYGTAKVIDVSHLTCVPIPTELQKNYPVSKEFKEKYPDIDYYGVYNVDVGVRCSYSLGNKEMLCNNKTDYLDANKDKESIKVENVDNGVRYCGVKVNFNNKDNVDLSKVDLINNPIIIEFTNKELNLSKSLVINSLEKLNANYWDVLLIKDKVWNFTVNSNSIIFDIMQGSFVTDKDLYTLTLDYTYLDNYIVASVGLNPIGTIDESIIDLATNPVKVILSNDKNTYQFVFDDNSKLNSYISQFVEMGDYEYTILSNQLIFASVSGNLTITTTDNIMLFNFALNLNSGELNFTINLTSESSSTSQIKLYATADTVKVVRDNLVASDTYNVVVYLYDANGKIVEQRIHLHSNSVTGECFAGWTIDSLVNGEHYTAQVRFVNPADSTITYLSDIIEFDYDNTKTYTFTYTASVVA